MTFRKLAFFLVLAASLPASGKISYDLDFSAARTNYVLVSMKVDNVKSAYIDIKMPVWAPGSYLVREFAKDVIAVTGENGEKVGKVDKNTWRIYKGKSPVVQVNYTVYAFELAVRNSFVDADHAYLNGTSIFMYVAGRKNEPHAVMVEKHPDWSTLSVALPRQETSEGYLLTAASYDELADSPVEYGNHTEWNFTAAGVPHTIAIYGKGSHESKKDSLIRDLTKIIEQAKAVFGHHPCSSYVFIIHNLDQGGGGLEHLNSTTCQVYRWNWSTESGYQGILSLLAHEYFHLWNVKRLRPVELGPFNYDEENYTHNLWVAEGVTSYYDELLLRRAGIFSTDKYLKTVTANLNGVVNTPGKKRQSLAEASYDAWIKFYRPNENSKNVSVSYYSKGAMVANLLDLIIISNTKGRKCLDDALKLMYDTYYLDKKRGYTDAELKSALEQVAGENLTWFFDKMIYGTGDISYEDIYKLAGLVLSDQNAKVQAASAGFTTYSAGGKTVVNYVEISGPAFGVINVNDEIIAVNGFRTNNDVNAFADRSKPGDVLEIMLARGGRVRTVQLTLRQRTERNYSLSVDGSATPEMQVVRKKWLGN